MVAPYHLLSTATSTRHSFVAQHEEKAVRILRLLLPIAVVVGKLLAIRCKGALTASRVVVSILT